jgi:hypothetical protein
MMQNTAMILTITKLVNMAAREDVTTLVNSPQKEAAFWTFLAA